MENRDNMPTTEICATLNAAEAKEWTDLQKAICQELAAHKITALAQIDPMLVEAFQIHLATCDVEAHDPIPGLFTAE